MVLDRRLVGDRGCSFLRVAAGDCDDCVRYKFDLSLYLTENNRLANVVLPLL